MIGHLVLLIVQGMSDWSEEKFAPKIKRACWYIHIPLCSLLTQGLAGIQPIDVPGIENVSKCLLHFFHQTDMLKMAFSFFPFQVDVTELLEGHSSYLWTTQQILEKLELDTYYPVFSSFPAKPQWSMLQSYCHIPISLRDWSISFLIDQAAAFSSTSLVDELRCD